MKQKIGIIILSISMVVWLAIFIVPFTNISTLYKTATITVLIVVGEITFYLGLFLVGKVLWNKYKEKVKNWFVQKFKFFKKK